jgi:hypothetical protein
MDRRDAVAVPWMAKFSRNPLPTRVVWKQDDVRHESFYWLAAPMKETSGRIQITAAIDKQAITLDGPAGKKILVRLSDGLANLDQTISITANGKQVYNSKVNRTIATLARTLLARHDPHLMFSTEIEIKLPPRN